MTLPYRLKIIVIVLAFPLYCASQEVLTFSSFLSSVRSIHPAARQALNIQQMGKGFLKAARGEYDPFINGTMNNKTLFQREYYTYSYAEIKQPLFTSQYLKAGYEYGSGAYINPEDRTPTYGLPFLGAEVSLLQGMMMDKRRAGVLKARAQKDVYEAMGDGALNELLLEASREYCEWLYLYKRQQLYEYFLLVAQKRTNGISQLAAAGERASVDTVEAAIYLQGRLIELLDVETDIVKKRATIARLWWRSANQGRDTTQKFLVADSLEALYVTARNKMLATFAEDFAANPVIREYRARQRALETDVLLAREQIKPRLDLGYNLLAVQPQVSYLTRNNYKWSLALSFPLLLRQSRAEYRLARLGAQNNLMEISIRENALMNRQAALRNNLGLLLKQVETAERTAAYSRILLEAEKLKFDNGESSLFMINNRESKWLDSELKKADFKLKLLHLYLEYIYLSGNLNFEF